MQLSLEDLLVKYKYIGRKKRVIGPDGSIDPIFNNIKFCRMPSNDKALRIIATKVPNFGLEPNHEYIGYVPGYTESSFPITTDDKYIYYNLPTCWEFPLEESDRMDRATGRRLGSGIAGVHVGFIMIDKKTNRLVIAKLVPVIQWRPMLTKQGWELNLTEYCKEKDKVYFRNNKQIDPKSPTSTPFATSLIDVPIRSITPPPEPVEPENNTITIIIDDGIDEYPMFV